MLVVGLYFYPNKVVEVAGLYRSLGEATGIWNINFLNTNLTNNTNIEVIVSPE